jgi:hypothetical protein
MKASVSEPAVVRRLRQFLLPKGEYLRIASTKKQKRWGFGRYYLLDKEGVISKDIDIKKLARDLKLLRPWESLFE